MIETQRYTRPYIPREDRVCSLCNKIEDEVHVFYDCPLYHSIRQKHEPFLSMRRTVKDILNPDHEFIIHTAKFIYDIECERKNMKL